jgi:hypothetical protein
MCGSGRTARKISAAARTKLRKTKAREKHHGYRQDHSARSHLWNEYRRVFR